MILILMGVSGTGKTTLGTMLSSNTGWPFLDGDDFFSAVLKAKMAAGNPLTDDDRAPWLATLHEKVRGYAGAGHSMILACSALKQQYRDQLRGALPPDVVRFALLEADPGCIADHLHHRTHEYMNPALLTSQLNTLQRPDDAWFISVEGTPEDSLAQLKSHLQAIGTF